MKQTSPGWYVVCGSDEVHQTPVRVFLLGLPIVLFRDTQGKIVALEDRCPHRNAPLSLGICKNGVIQCAYHGWEFNFAGECVRIPGTETYKPNAGVPVYDVIEQQGFVWVFSEPNEKTDQRPYEIPFFSDPKYTKVQYSSVLETTLFSAIENALDVPHTAFLHKGLFRKEEKQKISVTVRSIPNGIEARYEGEQRPTGILGKLIAPNAVVEHVDRFILPSIAEVEYKMGNELHIVSTTFFTPTEEGKVALHAVSTFKLRLPNALIRLIALPLAHKILKQDAAILQKQKENIFRFGREKFCFSSTDILGKEIAQLLQGKQEKIQEKKELFL